MRGGRKTIALLVLALSLLCFPLTAPSSSAGELVLVNAVIAEDTHWSGRVLLTGRTTVKKGAVLTIDPGTVVAFAWSDEDGNGIGDGELKVEGRLVARGTREKMITFTSAREEPRARDWTFVMVELGGENVVEHCLFEYAFTGLQVHFARATVRDSLFRRNFEAMRFSTADLLIEGNSFVGNTYGIRYESRGSETTIRRNDFTGNEYAFFPVVKCTSTVKIHGNNIESRGYNVKMGLEQRGDLDFRENWWGSADRDVIEGGFFDGRREESLGRVLYRPWLREPVKGSGRE
jgi:parallel beta-helix repeat protein